MAYGRKHELSRTSTFREEIKIKPTTPLSMERRSDENAIMNNPLPASYNASCSSPLSSPTIKASSSPARRHPSIASIFAQEQHQRSKSFDTYGINGNSKSAFWGVLAQRAKEILEEDNSYTHHIRSHSFNTFTPTPTSLAQEGRTMMEGNTRDLRSQLKLSKGSLKFRKDSNQGLGIWNPMLKQSAQIADPQTIYETQLKASRDVAMATAAKAKILMRELKTVKADLNFAKARCDQLEEENKLLREREGCDTGQDRADDDDLILLQIETLLEEKARLAKEIDIYSRENQFLREIVEYYQLTMQDVVYVDEDMEEVYPMDSTTIMVMSPRSTLSNDQKVQSTKSTMFPVPEQEQEHRNTSEEDESSSMISISKEEHAK